jgi:hypothetical protein
MKPIDLNKIEKIINEEASEQEIREFDSLFKEMPLETPKKEFTDEVIKGLKSAPVYTGSQWRQSFIAMGIVILFSIFFLLPYDNFKVPTLTDPLLQQWVPPVGESGSILKQLLLIANGILMLVLLDKFAIGPFFRKTSYS